VTKKLYSEYLYLQVKVMLSLDGRAHSEMVSTQPEGAASAGTKGTANSNENASEGIVRVLMNLLHAWVQGILRVRRARSLVLYRLTVYIV
jgi:hypothetical protein